MRLPTPLPAALVLVATFPYALVALAAAAVGQAPAVSRSQETRTPEQAPDRTFEARLDVVEARALVALPTLSRATIEELQPEDLVVVEEGLRRNVLRLTPATEPWTVVVYFDALLARPFTLPAAAHALTSQATTLADLGPVSVVWAGRYPDSLREEQAASRNAIEIEATLARLARRADNELAERLASPPTERAQREITGKLLSERTDLLVADLADRCPSGPCALLLVLDGYFLTADPELARITGEVERLMAGLGWIVLALPVRPDEETLDPAQREEYRSGVGTDYDAWKEVTGGVRIRRREEPPERLDLASANTVDAYTLPEWEPLRDWTRATAGGIASSATELAAELERLTGRWWLAYEAQRAASGALRPLEIRLAEASQFQSRRALGKALGLIPENTRLLAPDWARSGVPLELSAARWRRYSIRRTPPSGELRLAVAQSVRDASALTWETTADPVRARLTLQRRDGVVEHREVSLTPRDGAAELKLEPGERGLLLVHDLDSGAWGAIRTDGL